MKSRAEEEMVHTVDAAEASSSALRAELPRRVRWISGAASAIATRLDLIANPGGVVAHCETGSEDEDTDRFIRDCETWLGVEITRLKSEEFADTWAVWEKRRYMSGIAGAPCTSELKIAPRLAFQLPGDVNVFGYTADRRDAERAKHFAANYPDTAFSTPLIRRGLTKAACLAMIIKAGIKPPRVYEMGFSNANCIPCVKATSPSYWALVRKEFPDQFARAAAMSRDLGARLVILSRENGKNVRGFIDEVPANQPVTDAIAPSCDFLCHIAGSDLT